MDNMDSLTHMDSNRHQSFRFDKKATFSAQQTLASLRSKRFVFPAASSSVDIWTRKAPDFTPKLYRSLSFPMNQKKSKGISQSPFNPKERHSTVDEINRTLLPDIVEKRELPKFVSRYKPPDPHEARVIFVKTGKNPTAVFKDPKPHDFRQYEENITEFVTSYDRDPRNINFKSRHLNTIHLSQQGQDMEQKNTRGFITYKPAEPKWESKLILPTRPWPLKSASYTRHRRRRGIHTALIDRVDEKLTRIWEMEKQQQNK
ncbi:uncharacterized protein si:dkey-30e9.6 [Erpetoichthys calabaricus]|uniref:uncharacterized protein si:dkey-30e9.6 n=1 Tax=Erpetoichthys calabaricus TaxID=27687 RepID=UPI00109FC939|nr:uncharacterized protein si:dkey-30e9.6 [Erpetoichthys calabaricus]XP_028672992.1 uncharacterized protein si:dkey-30e9.6 [Erpetoichthys calabaricus]XP_028672993.1 uncharacterized protein si:dkey-30e9.6 [Erpetoichthys calabaricus]XP_051791681.1 uncharacterized protein si:dkey-30e9.6 [Erpetoichthys calabaricus]